MTSSDASTLEQQYAALTGSTGVAEIARTRIELTGRDRARFLHNFCTNEIKKLTPGTGCEIFITSVQGKILGHGHVLCEEERLVFDGEPGQAAALLPHLDKYLITEDVTLVDRSPEVTTLLVAGAEAAPLLASVNGAEVPTESNSHTQGNIAGVPVSLARLPVCGENTLLVTCPQEQAGAVQAALLAAGGIACQAEAVEVLRVEAGYPLFGQDIVDTNLPQEVDRDLQAISFTKGCYLGQETVARIDALGHVNKKLVGLKLSGMAVPTTADAIFASSEQEKPVGHITSAAFSSRLNAPLALAYIRAQHTAPGSKLFCAGTEAEVLALPFSS